MATSNLPHPDTKNAAQLSRLESGLRSRLGSAARAARPLLDRVHRHLPALRDELALLYGNRPDFEDSLLALLNRRTPRGASAPTT